ncbi:MAG TPA: 3-keto-5-aminohexanoate cleavage protein [Solirubrobacteraceae bacterium]|nr:3-keto-5-aminohexanoate cleavage protein [Solirubrobacteraceae bacterium]
MSMRAGAVIARAFSRSAAVQPQEPAILTCGVSGGLVTGNPNQPVTREEVVASAVEAARAGASIVHIHARTTGGEITQAPEDYQAIKQAIGEQTDVLLNFTTGGQLGAPAEESRRSLQARPDVATVTCGSMNFGPGGDLLISPPSLMRKLVEEMAAGEIVPEYECFDLGMAITAAALASSSDGGRGMMHMILGAIGGAPAGIETISLFRELVPSGVSWMVTAIPRHFPMMAVTLALGGHIRTGLEDVVYVAPGEYAQSNAQLVTRARAMCEAIGRPLATPAQAREILGIRSIGPA